MMDDKSEASSDSLNGRLGIFPTLGRSRTVKGNQKQPLDCDGFR
jgi:hypothetical protein